MLSRLSSPARMGQSKAFDRLLCLALQLHYIESADRSAQLRCARWTKRQGRTGGLRLRDRRFRAHCSDESSALAPRIHRYAQ